MAVTYTSNLKLALPTTGTEAGAWGDVVNQQITTLLDQSVAGTVSLTAMTNADYTLTNGNGSAANEARHMALLVPATLTLTVARNIIVPSTSKAYIIRNLSTGGFAVTLKTSAGSGISVPNGKTMLLYCDGTNVIDGATHFTSLTLGAALPVLSGGTGVTTSTGTGNNVLSSLPSFGTTIGVGGATASASGSGISFPATQSASTDANTLDDYEEGTWTPTLTIGGLTTGITYTTRSASYVKIGRIVYISLNIQLSSKGFLTGDVIITALPFTTNSAANGYAYFGAADYSAMSGATAHIYAQALNNSTSVYLCNGSIVSSAVNLAQDTDLLNTSALTLTGTYITS